MEKNRVVLTGRILVTSSSFTVRAKKVVVTIPIGVLKNSTENRICFEPVPANLQSALNGIEMGHVQKITFRFRNRFWEKLNTQEPVTFLHAGPEKFFPTWWTHSPVRDGIIVAWQGGPKAKQMSSWSTKQKVSVAFQTLSIMINVPIAFLEKNCLDYLFHDWSSDPFALGAYSYIKTDGMQNANKLRTPIENTLYFAGEGTCEDSSRGTVHGTLESGFRVAKLILKN